MPCGKVSHARHVCKTQHAQSQMTEVSVAANSHKIMTNHRVLYQELNIGMRYTRIRSSGLAVGSHGIVGRRAQKSGHQLAASPYWITPSGLASVTFHTKHPSF